MLHRFQLQQEGLFEELQTNLLRINLVQWSQGEKASLPNRLTDLVCCGKKSSYLKVSVSGEVEMKCKRGEALQGRGGCIETPN